MSEKEQIYHLLKPKEFRVWCVPSRPPGLDMFVTSYPSKATCANCLTSYRRAKGLPEFRVKWTNRYNPRPRTPEIEA